MRSVGTSPSARSWSRNRTSVASSAASVSLSGRTIRASGFLRMAWIQRSLPSRMPAWGPPISLSPLQVITSAPAATDSASVGSFSKPNWEKSMSGPAPTSSMTVKLVGLAQADQVFQRHFRREAHDLVVAGMDAEDRGRAFVDRPLVIAEMGLVGRAHLDELCAGGGHDLGQAKGAADFDQLAAGDDHFLAGGHGIEDDRRGGGVVVDHGGGLGPGEQPEDLLDPLVPSRPLTAGHVDLQDREAGQFPADLPQGPCGQHGPA